MSPADFAALVTRFAAAATAGDGAALAACFPGREIVPVDCLDLVWGLGAIHCLTQQQPARLPAKP